MRRPDIRVPARLRRLRWRHGGQVRVPAAPASPPPPPAGSAVGCRIGELIKWGEDVRSGRTVPPVPAFDQMIERLKRLRSYADGEEELAADSTGTMWLGDLIPRHAQAEP